MKIINTVLKCFTLFVLLSTLSGCSGFFLSANDKPVEEIDAGCAYFYFLWGRQAELSFQFEEALEAYQKALICDPAAEHITRKIPILLLRLDRGEEAVELLEKYIGERPEDTSYRMLLARVYIGLEKYDEAVKEYRAIHAMNPEETASLLRLSEMYLNRDMVGEAEGVLQEILQIKPDSYPARVTLGRIYFSSERYEKSLYEYDEALKLNWSAELLREKADVYRRLDKSEKVFELYREILEKEPDNEQAAFALVRLLIDEDREEEALEVLDVFRKHGELGENVELALARLYARMDNYLKAIELLQDMLAKNDDTPARYLLAVIFAQTEEYEKALAQAQVISKDSDEYEDAVLLQVRLLRYLDREKDAVHLLAKEIEDAESRTPEMFVMLAALYHLQDKIDQGESVFKKALDIFPEDGELYYEYGLFLDNSGKADQAMEVMEELIEREPANGDALNYVGYSWADQNINLDKALDYIKKAIELKPESAYVRDSLGWVYFRLGRLEEAREALELAVELAADDPEADIFDHLGDVYLELGRKDDALEAYRAGLALFAEDEEDELKESLQGKLQLLEEQVAP